MTAGEPDDAAQASALGGKLFSVSAWGADGTEYNHEALAAEVQALGGRFSSTVHRKVAFLLASAEAVERETQRVRKAWRYGVAVVRPTFLKAGVISSRARRRRCRAEAARSRAWRLELARRISYPSTSLI